MDALLTKDGSRYTLLFERKLAHSPKKVWRVLTERDLLRQWFPCDVEGEWKAGQALKFTFLHGEGDGLPDEELRGEVLTADAPSLLEFRWGSHFYRCELAPEGNGCKLLFSDTFEDGSEGARNAAGWDYCLNNLEQLLAGATIGRFTEAVWRKPFDFYVKEFEAIGGIQQGMPDDYPAAED